MTREPDAASLAGAILAGANRTFLVPAVLAQVLQAGPDAVALFGAAQDLHVRRGADAAAAAAGGDARPGRTPTSSRSTGSPRWPAWPPT